MEEKIAAGHEGYHKHRDLESMQALRKKLWGLRISPKMRVLGWRACSNVLPTKSRLQSKGIIVNQECYLC